MLKSQAKSKDLSLEPWERSAASADASIRELTLDWTARDLLNEGVPEKRLQDLRTSAATTPVSVETLLLLVVLLAILLKCLT